MRQLVEPFVNPNFNAFPIKQFQNLAITTFTRYLKEFQVPVAFPPQEIAATLAKVLSQNTKRQLHLAETEK